MRLPIYEAPRPTVSLNPGKYMSVVDSQNNVIALFALVADAREYVMVHGHSVSRMIAVEVIE